MNPSVAGNESGAGLADSNLGRGAFTYMTVVTILSLINLLWSYFFIDVHAAFPAVPDQPGRMEGAALINILLNLGFLFWNSMLTKGWVRTLLAFTITVLIAFLAEGLGVHYGMVFGPYHYTGMLGVQIWAVPVIVCLAWEPILYSAYCVTDFLLPTGIRKSDSLLRRLVPYLLMAVVGGIATTAWDLMMDPFAVDRGWWVWHQGGPYMRDIENGVPISNFFGWFKVAFVCNLVYRVILDTAPAPRRSLYLSVYGPLMLYLNLLIGGLGAALLFLKRPDVMMIGVACMGAIFLMAFLKVCLLRLGVEVSPGYGWLMDRARGR